MSECGYYLIPYYPKESALKKTITILIMCLLATAANAQVSETFKAPGRIYVLGNTIDAPSDDYTITAYKDSLDIVVVINGYRVQPLPRERKNLSQALGSFTVEGERLDKRSFCAERKALEQRLESQKAAPAHIVHELMRYYREHPEVNDPEQLEQLDDHSFWVKYHNWPERTIYCYTPSEDVPSEQEVLRRWVDYYKGHLVRGSEIVIDEPMNSRIVGKRLLDRLHQEIETAREGGDLGGDAILSPEAAARFAEPVDKAALKEVVR